MAAVTSGETYQVIYRLNSNPNKWPTFQYKAASQDLRNEEESNALTGDCSNAGAGQRTTRSCLAERVDRLCIGIANCFIKGFNCFRCYEYCSLCNRANLRRSGDSKVSSRALWCIRIAGITTILALLSSIAGLYALSTSSGSSDHSKTDISVVTTPEPVQAVSTPLVSNILPRIQEILDCEKQLQRLIFLGCKPDPTVYNSSSVGLWRALIERIDKCFTTPAANYWDEVIAIGLKDSGKKLIERAVDKTQDFCAKAKLGSLSFPKCEPNFDFANIDALKDWNEILQGELLKDVCSNVTSALNMTSTFKV